MDNRLYISVMSLFVAVLFSLFMWSSHYHGYGEGLAEGKKLVSPSMDAKEQIHTGTIIPQVKPEPDTMPWENRWKQIKHLKAGESTSLFFTDFSVADNGVVWINIDAEVTDKDFSSKLKVTELGYEIWLKKDEKFRTPNDRDVYIRTLTGRWREVQKIHLYEEGKRPW